MEIRMRSPSLMSRAKGQRAGITVQQRRAIFGLRILMDWNHRRTHSKLQNIESVTTEEFAKFEQDGTEKENHDSHPSS